MTVRQFLVVALLLLLLPAAAACGGDDESEPTAGPSGVPAQTPDVVPSTGGTAGGPSPLLFGPASRFTASEEDLEFYYRADSSSALVTNDELYGRFGPFKNREEGQDLAATWGYEEGYMVGFDPAGLLSAVVQGNYYITVESHLFSTVEGAEQAYQQYVEFYADTPGVEAQPIAALGNESTAWRAIGGGARSHDRHQRLPSVCASPGQHHSPCGDAGSAAIHDRRCSA